MDPTVAKWTATEGVDTPESGYLDTESGSLFVSEIVGMADVRVGNGRISKLTPDGADIDEVIGIMIATGKIQSRVKIK